MDVALDQTYTKTMDEQPDPLALAALKQFHLLTWDNAQIIQPCDLAAAGVPPWKLWTHSKHDIIRDHGVELTYVKWH